MEIEKTMLTYNDIWDSNIKFIKKFKITLGAQPSRFVFSFIIWNIPNIVLISQIANLIQFLCILTFSALMSNMFLFVVLFSNPGIIPKNIIGFEIQKELFQVPQITKYSSTKNFDGYMINNENYMLSLKYCAFCHIFRPPRSGHCHTCGNCILKYDHHCPWIGQCIGQNNYRKYIQLLLFGELNLVCIFLTCSYTINENIILKIIIIIYAIPVNIQCLQTLHFYLIITKQTSKEFFNKRWYTKAGNPFKSKFWQKHPEFINFNSQFYRNKNITYQQFTQVDLSIQTDKTIVNKQPIKPYKEFELQIIN